MTEDELGAEVWRLVKSHGLTGYHTHNSQRSQAGFPDWTIVGKRIMFRELKSASGTLSGDQARWRYALQATGADWGLWRPCDLSSGRIDRELADLTVGAP